MEKMEKTPEARAWLEIDLDIVRDNFRKIREAAPGMSVRAVIKADAYGLGARRTGEVLKESGADGFCVACFQEAKALLPLGLPIQILGTVFDFELPEAVASGVILPITGVDAAERISAEAVRQNTTAECHLKIDTGMGRMGILAEHAADVIREAAKLPGIRITGIYSHFPNALPDPDSSAFSARQIARFARTVRTCRKAGLDLPLIHVANSDAFLNYPETRTEPYTGIRVGLALWGETDRAETGIQLRNAVSFRARLASFRVLPAGSSVGYNRTCRLTRDTLTGTVSAGYADGLPLALSNKGEFLFHGKRCRILGRISMDYTVIDLSGFITDDLTFGEPVTCFGTDRQECITAGDWGRIAGTHAYNVLTGIGPRVLRVYKGE